MFVDGLGWSIWAGWTGWAGWAGKPSCVRWSYYIFKITKKSCPPPQFGGVGVSI